jgi:hypothetical protein
MAAALSTEATIGPRLDDRRVRRLAEFLGERRDIPISNFCLVGLFWDNCVWDVGGPSQSSTRENTCRRVST